MIDLMLRRGGDIILITIKGKQLYFARNQGGYFYKTTIDGLKFSVAGVLKQFPDLEDKENQEILKIGKERFKDHIRGMKSEEEIKNYLIEDLKKHGYMAMFYQRKGFRPIKCH
jgi:uncharacterized protein (UPF0128 family)